MINTYLIRASEDSNSKGAFPVILNILLYDVDDDLQLEALVFLKYQPLVSVACGDKVTHLASWLHPDGTPIGEIKTGVVVVELDGETEQPFTYYPELVLK